MLPEMSKQREIRKSKMIKTLQIATVITAILAGCFFVSPAVFGISGDKQTEQFLSYPGAIEKFNKSRGDKNKRSGNQTSPLVKEAEAFALYLNPPPKPKPKIPLMPRGQKESAEDKPAPPSFSAKFELIGTSFYAHHPEMSLALIDEAGKGLRWVRQSSKVGHLIIEQVKDGVVVVRDGQKTSELVADRPKKINLLKGKGTSSGKTGSEPVLTVSDKGKAGDAGSKPPQIITEAAIAKSKKAEPAQMSAEEEALVKKMFAEMEAMLSKTEDHNAVENTALTEKFTSDLESMRVGNREAGKLDHLGRKLKDVSPDPNQTKKTNDSKIKRGRRVKRPVPPPEPNSPPKKTDSSPQKNKKPGPGMAD